MPLHVSAHGKIFALDLPFLVYIRRIFIGGGGGDIGLHPPPPLWNFVSPAQLPYQNFDLWVTLIPYAIKMNHLPPFLLRSCSRDRAGQILSTCKLEKEQNYLLLCIENEEIVF